MIRRHSRPRDRSDERLESLGWKCRIVRLGATATQHVQQSSRARAASPAPPRSSRHSHGDASQSSRRRARWRDRGAARGSRRTPRCAPAWRLRSTALRRDHSHNSSRSSQGSRGRACRRKRGAARGRADPALRAEVAFAIPCAEARPRRSKRTASRPRRRPSRPLVQFEPISRRDDAERRRLSRRHVPSGSRRRARAASSPV